MENPDLVNFDEGHDGDGQPPLIGAAALHPPPARHKYALAWEEIAVITHANKLGGICRYAEIPNIPDGKGAAVKMIVLLRRRLIFQALAHRFPQVPAAADVDLEQVMEGRIFRGMCAGLIERIKAANERKWKWDESTVQALIPEDLRQFQIQQLENPFEDQQLHEQLHKLHIGERQPTPPVRQQHTPPVAAQHRQTTTNVPAASQRTRDSASTSHRSSATGSAATTTSQPTPVTETAAADEASSVAIFPSIPETVGGLEESQRSLEHSRSTSRYEEYGRIVDRLLQSIPNNTRRRALRELLDWIDRYENLGDNGDSR